MLAVTVAADSSGKRFSGMTRGVAGTNSPGPSGVEAGGRGGRNCTDAG